MISPDRGGEPLRPRVDVVLPVHEEAATLVRVLDELYGELSKHIDPRFIVCEAGSRDGTRELLETLRQRFPMVLHSHPERRSYTAAIIEGLQAAETEHVLVLDSDGQCDPRDLPRFLVRRTDADITVGQRLPRRDPAVRQFISFMFGLLHRALFGVTVRDPSCPFALMRRAAVVPLLDQMGRLPSGFWWELAARAKSAALSMNEVPIRHRERLAGKSRAIRLAHFPSLAVTHALGLVRIRMETGTLRRKPVAGRPGP